MSEQTTTAESDAAASEAAKKLAATIVKRSNETVERILGVKVAFKPNGLATLIDTYLDDARKEGRRQRARGPARLGRLYRRRS